MPYKYIIFLIALNFAHFLGDFTPLNKWMIKAKRYGKPVSLVLVHGAVNGALYLLVALLFVGIKPALLVFAIETVGHTLIDVLKGRVNHRFPVVEDQTKAIHWAVMGADQLLHQIVLILIVFLIYNKSIYIP